MLKRIAGMVALSLLVVAELQAGIFGSRGGGGGCANGQCNMRTYQPVYSSAQAPAAVPTAVAATEAPAPAVVAETAQPRYSVANQPIRGRFGRRWSR